MGLGLYSFAIFGAVLWLAIGYVLLRRSNFPVWSRVAGWIAAGVVLFAIWIAVRPTATAGMQTLDDVTKVIGNGKPTVIEFFSDT
ncbi:MAG TPA: hypothetical protein VKQ72_07275 [Aggregatilineales bacterium]|nr:hypothetical protein [Aggregatilineales bacterium]